MHECPECGKAMATVGGLEIHLEMQHAPAPAAPEPQSALHAEVAPVPMPSPAVRRAPAPILRGFDPTVPLTALLVLALLVAGVGAAVHRSTNPSHPAVASLNAGASTAETPTTLAPVPPTAPARSASSPGGSPAAIPPAGSQSPATAQNSADPDCTRLVDSLSNRNSKRSVDLVKLVQTNTFPALPLPGFEHPSVQGYFHYGTASEYVDSTDLDPADADAWKATMIKDGFVGSDRIEYVNGDSSYGAGVLQFTTAAGARDFNKTTALLSCNEGVLDNAHVMPGLTGGMNYLIEDDGPPFRATFVAGDTVVRLHICHCVQAPDDQVLAGQWAQAVATAVGAG